MRTATAVLTGVSSYSQGRKVQTERTQQQDFKKFEEATWRERMHVDGSGNVFIPPMAFKNCLSDAAKFLSMRVPGKGQKTYGGIIDSGIMVVEPATVIGADKKPVKAESVPGEWLFVPSDGKRGGGSRVDKCFPIIREGWSVTVNFILMNDMITDEIFTLHLESAGKFIGLGRFRPKNGGYYGRFLVSELKWTK
jgi:hypothetical protein